MVCLTTEITTPVVAEPDKKKPDKKNDFAVAVWERKVAAYVDRVKALEENL